MVAVVVTIVGVAIVASGGRARGVEGVVVGGVNRWGNDAVMEWKRGRGDCGLWGSGTGGVAGAAGK